MVSVVGVLVVAIATQFTLCVVRVDTELAAVFYLMMIDHIKTLVMSCMFVALIESCLKLLVTYWSYCANNRSDELMKMMLACASVAKALSQQDESISESYMEMTKNMTELIKLKIEKHKSDSKTESSAGSVDAGDAVKLKDEISPASESSSSRSAAITLSD